MLGFGRLRRLLRPLPLKQEILRREPRWKMILRALEFVNFERVEGDVLEFGVSGGLSLVAFGEAMRYDPKGMQRRLVGFDSFEGLPASGEVHARWGAGDCRTVLGWHPLLAAGETVTPQVVRDLFGRCGLAPPNLEVGAFGERLRATIPAVYPRAAILHVDCDLYDSTREVLSGVAPILQEGTVVLFDDWFHYRGRPDRGEARAFAEFLAANPAWRAVEWQAYSTFCKAFILTRAAGGAP